MVVTLFPVPGFGSYPDGRLRAGPFHVRSAPELQRLLDRSGLRPGRTGDVGFVSQMATGIHLSASGPGVTGYLLDSDDLEAARSDLDMFIIHAVAPGVPCHVAGHWSPDPDCTIQSDATAIHDGTDVIWAERRMLMRADGSQKVIKATAPAALPARRLRLA